MFGYFWLKNALQWLACEARELLDFPALHPVREMRKLALEESLQYIRENMKSAIGAYTARQVLDIALARTTVSGHFLEFGVYRGGSIRHIAKRMPKQTIHGFDSFEGLPQAWAGHSVDRGAFSLGGKLPRVPKSVVLHAGWYHDSLPQWMAGHPGACAFIHIDCDLYSSTKTVLDLIADRLQPGTVIVFDEYFGYAHWREHEFKAFQECVAKNHIRYEYIAYSRFQAAIKIVSIGS
jgi:predicted O-methyltransferase YrrM